MADGGKKNEIGEFMTHWDSDANHPRNGFEAWATRDKSQLLGNFTSTYYVPKFRPFDLLSVPNTEVIFLENEDHRIGAESVVGAQDCFHRYVDMDIVYFQYCGNTTLETEFGVYDMEPGEVMFIPQGIAHRSTGTADSLRYFLRAYEPITHVIGDDQYMSEKKFTVTRTGGPNWTIPKGTQKVATSGRVVERMHCWRDGPDDLTIGERDYDSLVNSTRMGRHEEGSKIRKIRAFDFFAGIPGKSDMKGPPFPLIESPNLMVRTYNMIGEQFAFHRALKGEEVRIQFRGNATEMCEVETVPIQPGEITMMPRGIAHSVITDPPDNPNFLRLNFYSRIPWRTPADVTAHKYNSTFEVKTNLVKEADWRIKLFAQAAE